MYDRSAKTADSGPNDICAVPGTFLIKRSFLFISNPARKNNYLQTTFSKTFSWWKLFWSSIKSCPGTIIDVCFCFNVTCSTVRHNTFTHGSHCHAPELKYQASLHWYSVSRMLKFCSFSLSQCSMILQKMIKGNYKIDIHIENAYSANTIDKTYSAKTIENTYANASTVPGRVSIEK